MFRIGSDDKIHDKVFVMQLEKLPMIGFFSSMAMTKMHVEFFPLYT